jgi:hypothetical protein
MGAKVVRIATRSGIPDWKRPALTTVKRMHDIFHDVGLGGLMAKGMMPRPFAGNAGMAFFPPGSIPT